VDKNVNTRYKPEKFDRKLKLVIIIIIINDIAR